MFNRYGAICAEIYDIDKPLDRPRPDVAFYRERLAALEGPILEPAVGSGRALIPLLEAGLDVRGFDASEEMLARCRARCAERGLTPELRRARFEDFAYGEPFAAIVLPVGTFTLIDDFMHALTVLARFHAHLRPGGLLMLDVGSLAELAARGEGVRRWQSTSGDTFLMEVRREETDHVRQTFTQHMRYERWRGGRLVDTELDVMIQRAWGVQELTLALGAAGFGDVVVSGDYARGRPLRASDRSFTFEAVRP
jgi:SAM-dependent methyltransferase